MAFRPEGNMRVDGAIFGRGAIWHYLSAINSTSARNKQSIFVLLSHRQKCTLIGEITGLHFSWTIDENSKKYLTISACGRFSNYLIGLLFALAYSGSTSKDISMAFWYYLSISNGLKYSLHHHPSAFMKNTRRLPSGKHMNILFIIDGVNMACWLWPMQII